MAQEDDGRELAQRARGLDELAVADRQRLGADHARERRPADEADHEHQADEAGAEHPQHGEVQDRVRDGDQGVDQPRDGDVEPAAEVSGHDSQRDAQQRLQRHAGHADEERDAAAVDQAAEDVAAQVVGAEEVLLGAAGPRGRRQPGPQVGGGGVERRQLRREERHHHEGDEHQGAERGDRARQQPPQERQEGAHE